MRGLRPVLVFAGAGAAAALLFGLQSLPPGAAARGLAVGALGDAAAWCSTLRVLTPLLLCATGVLLAFRSGFWNIGAEGQLLVGALAAAAAGLWVPHWSVALLAGLLAGFAWAAVPAWLARRRGVPEVLSTLLLNAVALELLRWLVTGPLQEPTRQFPQSAALAASARLPEIAVDRAGTLHLGLPLALLAVVVVGLLLARTRAGLVLRAGAQAPRLVRAAGYPHARWQILAFGGAGALAGLAGSIEVTGVVGAVDRSFAQGTGYAAIAAALLARLNPWLLLPAALLFAVLATGTASLQWLENLPGIDRSGLLLQAIVFLATLAAWPRRGRMGEAAA